MVRTEMALPARRWQTGDGDRRCMTSVARRTRANRPVVIRFADAVAPRAAARRGRRPLDRSQRMRRTAGPARLKPLGECDLFRTEALLAENRSPRGCGMPAAQVLLIDRLVTAPAVAGRQAGRDRESVVVLLLLPGCRLVTVEAVDATLRVSAQFVLMDD